MKFLGLQWTGASLENLSKVKDQLLHSALIIDTKESLTRFHCSHVIFKITCNALECAAPTHVLSNPEGCSTTVGLEKK
jgi:hypothetical protein